MPSRRHSASWALLCVGLTLLAGCGLMEPQPSPTRPVRATPLSAKEAYPIAKARADQWQPACCLEHLWMSLPPEDIARGPRTIGFSFLFPRLLGPLT